MVTIALISWTMPERWRHQSDCSRPRTPPQACTLDNTNVVHGEGDRRGYSSCNEGDGLFEIMSEKGDIRETLCAWLRRVREPPNGQKQVSLLLHPYSSFRKTEACELRSMAVPFVYSLDSPDERPGQANASRLAIIGCL